MSTVKEFVGFLFQSSANRLIRRILVIYSRLDQELPQTNHQVLLLFGPLRLTVLQNAPIEKEMRFLIHLIDVCMVRLQRQIQILE